MLTTTAKNPNRVNGARKAWADKIHSIERSGQDEGWWPIESKSVSNCRAALKILRRLAGERETQAQRPLSSIEMLILERRIRALVCDAAARILLDK
jgi:hypothetical protein